MATRPGTDRGDTPELLFFSGSSVLQLPLLAALIHRLSLSSNATGSLRDYGGDWGSDQARAPEARFTAMLLPHRRRCLFCVLLCGCVLSALLPSGLSSLLCSCQHITD